MGLEEIVQLLQCQQDALTYDVHCLNPEAQALLHSVEAEYDDRPDSVQSYVLDDPQRYQGNPKAILKDKIDYWGT